MRNILSLLIFVVAFPFSAFAMHQINYIGELPIEGPVSIVFDDEGQIYVSQDIGTIKVMTRDGKTVMTLGGKDKKWEKILKKPAGLAIYDGKLYVADSSLGHIAVFGKDGTFLESFGRKGSKHKQFSHPQDIFIYKGVIYVADKGNNRIQVLGPNGVFLGEIGVTGKGEERLNKPLDLAVDHRGYIYVVDGKDKCLKVYMQDGKYYKKFKGIRKSCSIAVDKDGIFVSDLGITNIKKFDFQFEKVMSFGTKGKGRAQFGSIAGIAVDSSGRVYVTDPKRKLIHIFHPERSDKDIESEYMPPPTSVRWLESIKVDAKQKITKIVWDGKDTVYAVDGKKGAVYTIKNGEFVEEITIPKCKPISVAIDKEKNLWILDNKSVIKLRNNGEVDFSFGSSGSSEGCFSFPKDIAISNKGIVYIAESGNKRVQTFNTDGVFLGVVAKDGAGKLMKTPHAIAVDSKGALYVLDRNNKSVMTFSSHGMLLREFGIGASDDYIIKKPVGIAVTDDKIFILDAGTSNIKMFSKEGKFISEFSSEGKGNGDLKNPTSITLIDDIKLLVSDTGNSRIQSFMIQHTPAPPQNVTAKGDTRGINIHWEKDSESFVEKYAIYKSDAAGGKFGFLAETSDASYVDKDVLPEKEYHYVVTAFAREGNEGFRSETVSAVPIRRIVSAPTGLKATPYDFFVELTWDRNKEDCFTHYIVYRKVDAVIKEVGRTDEPFFTDKGLEPVTRYLYNISAVSTDDVESEKTSIETKTFMGTRPPLEIDVLEMQDIFSNTYKVYENKGIGRIRITNNTKDRISKLKVSFSIKNFMDFPSETELENLPPGENMDFTLKAVFNNKILDVTEDTPVQTEITVSYYSNQQLKTFSKNYTTNIYEKHKMTWDDRERVAAFVTTKDSVLLEFTRYIATQYRVTSEPLLYASVIFNALGVMGMTYMQDPANPYQITSGKTDFVDYLQYPRETLKRKSGDCDDLVILYSAALESLGIRTRFIEIPGHMFMMFSVGMVTDFGEDTMDGLFVIDEGRVWAPIEVTMVGEPFIRAWEVGSKKYYEWEGRGLNTMQLHSAWLKYKPASLPLSDWRPESISRDVIEKRFNNEFKSLLKMWVKIRGKKYLKVLNENPNDVNAYLQLGIAYAEAGETGEALRLFAKALKIDPKNAALVNNLGNVHFLEGRYAEAAKTYEKSVTIDPDDYLVWVNLAGAYLRLNKTDKAKKAFSSAHKIEPKVSKEFRSMSLKLLGQI